MKTKIVTIIFTLYLFFGLSYSAYSGEKNGNNKNSAFFLSDEKANKVYQRNMLADLLTKIIFYKWDFSLPTICNRTRKPRRREFLKYYNVYFHIWHKFLCFRLEYYSKHDQSQKKSGSN